MIKLRDLLENKDNTTQKRFINFLTGDYKVLETATLNNLDDPAQWDVVVEISSNYNGDGQGLYYAYDNDRIADGCLFLGLG